MKVVTCKEYAAFTVREMSSEDKNDIVAAGSAKGWRDGISSWDLGNLDLDDLLEEIWEVVMDEPRKMGRVSLDGGSTFQSLDDVATEDLMESENSLFAAMDDDRYGEMMKYRDKHSSPFELLQAYCLAYGDLVVSK